MPTSRTTAQRRAAVAKRAPATARSSSQPQVVKWEPVRIVTTADAPILDREPLFYIDDVEFTIPKTVPPNVTVGYIRDMRNGSTEKATARVFDALLGKEGLDALADCDALESDQLKEIMRVIEEKVLAAAEEMQGN